MFYEMDPWTINYTKTYIAANKRRAEPRSRSRTQVGPSADLASAEEKTGI